MCISVPRRVIRIENTSATLSDGRVVRLGLITGVKQGDYLEVYGDIALRRLTPDMVQDEFDIVSTVKD